MLVVMIGDKEEEDMGIKGNQLHSHDALYPMVGLSPPEPLDLLQRLFA